MYPPRTNDYLPNSTYHATTEEILSGLTFKPDWT